MAEQQRIINWNGFCAFDRDDCCNAEIEDDTLQAGSEIWYLPLGTSGVGYNLYDCNGDLVTEGFGTDALVVDSYFKFTVTGICTDAEPTDCEENPCQDDCGCEGASGFRFSAVYRDVDNCTPVFECSSAVIYAGSESVFLDAIVTLLSSYFAVVFRVGNEITVSWKQTTDIPDDWRCRAILTTRTDFATNETECNPWIEGDCLLTATTLNRATNRCTQYQFLEQMQLQGSNVCLTITHNKECIDAEPMIAFDWDGVPPGNYYIQSDYGCSQVIEVGSVCDTVIMNWRNWGTQPKSVRIGAVIRNPTYKKKQQVVYQPDNTLRKIYSNMETTWSITFARYRAKVHGDLAAILDSDYLQFNSYFEDRWIKQTKDFVNDAEYNINWSDAFPTQLTATADTTITEVTTETTNNYNG